MQTAAQPQPLADLSERETDWLDRLDDLDMLVVVMADGSEIYGWKFQLETYARRGSTFRPITDKERADYERDIKNYSRCVREEAARQNRWSEL